MKTITQEQWNKIPSDYKMIDDKGQRKILEWTNNGTTLIPVRIDNLQNRVATNAWEQIENEVGTTHGQD